MTINGTTKILYGTLEEGVYGCTDTDPGVRSEMCLQWSSLRKGPVVQASLWVGMGVKREIDEGNEAPRERRVDT